MKGAAFLAAWVLTIVLAAPLVPSVGSPSPTPAPMPLPPASSPPIPPALFVENAGQIRNTDVRFYVNQGPTEFGFAERGVLIRLTAVGREVLARATFEGANPVAPEGREMAAQRNHYFLGSDPARWRTDVPTFRMIAYENLYPGIDLRYRVSGGGLKYEFEVAAGADPAQIRIAYEGIAGLTLAPAGDLVVRTVAGDVRDTAPIAIQPGAAIACSFALRAARAYGFDCQGQDASRPFTIDPLLFATYLGGSDYEDGRAVTIDGAGNVYVAGETGSTDFPTTPGAYNRTFGAGPYDAFVAKFDSTGGSLLYSTFLGGSDDDHAYALAVDAAGDAFVAGLTYSGDFPTTPGALDRALSGGSDAFVAKLSPSGSGLLYSTLLGGSIAERVAGLVLDSSGDAFLAGETASSDFPTTPGAFDRTYGGGFLLDGFVAGLNPAGGALLFATFLGGSGADSAFGIARDASGNLYVTGLTTSTNFPATSGALSGTLRGISDAFVAKFDPTGSSLLYATYLGGAAGAEGDTGSAISVDASGDAYVGGYTNTPDFPVTPLAWDTTCGTDGLCDFDGFQPYTDGFVAKVNATGTGLVYATYLGGASHDEVHAIALDGLGRATVTGSTRSSDFPTTPGADYATFIGGLYDAFVTKVNATGAALTYSTFFGGGENDETYGLAVDAGGIAYVTGVTNSTDLPATPGAYDGTCGTDGACDFDGFQSYPDAFVARLVLAVPLQLATVPPGLQVRLDGNLVTTPYTYACDGGSVHTVEAPAVQTAYSTRFAFRSWSDGGPATHDVTCTGPDTLIAIYDETDYEITLTTSPPGLQVLFDGSPNAAPYVVWCGVSSGHTISTLSPQVFGTTRYLFSSWSDAGPQMHGIVCNAPTTYTATFTTEYEVTVTAIPLACQLEVDSFLYAPPVQFWWSDGSSRVLNVPSPQPSGGTQYLFQSWSDGGGQRHSVVIRAAVTYTAVCATQHNITVQTSPPGLQVLVNGSAYSAPYAFWCDAGASIALDVPSPQGSPPTRYLFSNWSDGFAQAHTVTCASPTVFVARFSTQHQLTLASVPTGRTILLDGNASTTPSQVWCTEGTNPLLEAPSPQGSGGTRHLFQSWSDGGPGRHTIDCTQPQILTATFDTEHLVTVATSPPGLQVTVDGVPGPAPVTNWWIEGSSHPVDVASPQGAGGTRAVFVTWSDGGTLAHDVVVTGPLTLTASFRVEHQVILDTFPTGLEVELNGTAYPTPVSFWLADRSAWTVGVASQDGSAGVRYAWGPSAGWSDGGAQLHGITVNGPMMLTATLETQYLLTLRTAHGSPWCDRNETGCWYPKDATATFEIDPYVHGGPGVQYAFRGWTGDLNLDRFRPVAAILMDGPKTETAQWVTQYYLYVIAQPGEATGDGWYEAGSQAPFGVNATEITGSDGKRLRFAGWSYDFNGTAASGTLLMDAPKTVIAHWVEVPFLETAWVIFVLPAIAAFLILIFLIWRRRRKKEPEDAAGAEEGTTEPDEPARSSEFEEELDLHTSA